MRTQSFGKEDSKYLRLFDIIDSSPEFNDEKIIDGQDWVRREQFSNLKANLYKKILQSLKEYTTNAHEDISIRETIDHIQILFDRSLYTQSIQLLQKVKRAMRKSDNQELHLEVLKWEKNL